MDIFAHSLWASAGLVIWQGDRHTSAKCLLLTGTFAALPDILHNLPVAVWSVLQEGSLLSLRQYVFASPDDQPMLSPMVTLVAHHLHCIMHSALTVGAISLISWFYWRAIWIPLIGWWSHVLIDVFTHSKDFYPSPVFYPLTMRGFNGIAWNDTWFLILNYLLLTAVFFWIIIKRGSRQGN